MGDASIAPEVLREQYGGTGPLQARQSLWAHNPGPSLVDVVLAQAGLRGGERVVDIGCGNGLYLAELRRRGHSGPLLGLDRSAAMAAASAPSAPTVVADATALPLGDGAVDVALCLHMLYHVPDIPQAVRELRRVVHAGGVTLVATNGLGHTAELTALLLRAAKKFEIDGDPHWASHRFHTERAQALMREAFDDVAVVDAGGTFLVPDPAVVADYLASIPPEAVGLTAQAPTWQAIQAEAAALCHRHGPFMITSRAAVLVCR